MRMIDPARAINRVLQHRWLYPLVIFRGFASAYIKKIRGGKNEKAL